MLDSYLRDLETAKATGRNPIAEKYARMMEDTAPEKFRDLIPNLPVLSDEALHIISEILRIQLDWMDKYVRLYPLLSSGNRAVRKEQALFGETSFETYLRGELSTYSIGTLRLYLDFVNCLLSDGRNLLLLTMNHTVQYYGYENLDTAEKSKTQSK